MCASLARRKHDLSQLRRANVLYETMKSCSKARCVEVQRGLGKSDRNVNKNRMDKSLPSLALQQNVSVHCLYHLSDLAYVFLPNNQIKATKMEKSRICACYCRMLNFSAQSFDDD